MREIVHIQAGQCGNQIGAKVCTVLIMYYNTRILLFQLSGNRSTGFQRFFLAGFVHLN